MKIRLKRLLNKHKNRIVSFISVIAFIPLLCISSFAADVSPDVSDGWYLLPFNDLSQTSSNCDGVFDSVSGTYNGSLSGGNSTDWPLFTVDDVGGVFPYIESGHNYLIYYTCSFETPIATDLNRIVIRINYTNVNDGRIDPNKVFSNSTYVNNTSTMSGLLSYSASVDNIISTASGILFDFTNDVSINGRVTWAFYIKDITHNSQEQINSIIASINNQTDVLGGYINNGNGSTGGIVSGSNSAIDNLDEVVSEYHATEQQFFDDFNSNQQAITSDIVGWSWGGLVNCANWVGETMTDYYNNMGDFRQFIIYPLMLGIALFFLGRGSSIIGHLYRKPTTTFTHTESRSTMSNGVRHTNTVTTRNGGVFRK